MNRIATTSALLVLASQLLSGQTARERDIIYQRTEGVALTMDVFVPEKPNGVGIIKIVSGGWKSRYESVSEDFPLPYTDHGYTVFAVFHGSQPRYKVRDIIGFMHRAVRFIRTNAARWSIDPDRIGVTGSSAGGHLSLILATTGGPGDSEAEDPVDRAGSAVQAVGVFYPPTDYLNFHRGVERARRGRVGPCRPVVRHRPGRRGGRGRNADRRRRFRAVRPGAPLDRPLRRHPGRALTRPDIATRQAGVHPAQSVEVKWSTTVVRSCSAAVRSPNR